MNISLPTTIRQQSDCFEEISRAYIVRRMAAKKLTPEQKADAQRLTAAFKAWKAAEITAGRQASQAILGEALEIGQSATSQYMRGLIPLNASALLRFSRVLGVSPESISPAIVREEHARAQAWINAAPPPRAIVTVTPVTPIFTRESSGHELVKTAQQKRRKTKPKPRVK